MIVEGPNGLRIEFPDGTDRDTINRVMSEAHAKRSGAKPAQPAQPAKQPAGPNLSTKPEEQSGVDKFLTGLDRLPNLVGAGRFGVLGDQSTGNKDQGQALSDFGGGATQALQATGRAATNVLGPVDDAVIAGISELTTNDAETFGQKFQRTQEQADQLREDQPLASGVGDVIGFGYGGTLLGRAGITGVGKQSAYLAGGHALLENPTDPVAAAQEAAISAVFGKTLQGIGDNVIKPVANFVAPRVGRAFAGKAAKATEEFKIPEAQVQRIANRLKQPVAQIRSDIDEYVKVNGVDANILAVVGDDTAEAFGQLSRAKKGAATAFREGEEAAVLARPDRIAGAVARTGDTQTATAALDDLAARGQAAASRTTQLADEAAATTKATTLAGQRAVDDSAAAATRNATLQGKQTQRMVRDETAILAQAEKAKIDASAAKLSEAVQARAKGIATDEAVSRALKEHTDNVMHGAGGLAKKRITLTKGWLNKNFPENPRQIAAVLRAKADTLPKGAARNRLLKAIDSMTGGADDAGEEAASKGWEALKLTLDDVDTLRRTLKKPVDVAGVKYNLTKAGSALRDYAAKKHPAYQTEYLDVFSNTMKGLDARTAGAMATGKKAAVAAEDVMAAAGKAATPQSRDAIVTGAREGALRAIAQTTKDGAQTLKSASLILRNAEAIIKLAGKDGEELVKTVRATMQNVQKIQDEIADIAAASRTTREGIADDVRQQVQKIADDATAAKRVLTDKQVSRLKTLERAAKAQLDAIKAAMSRNTRAIDAASKVLTMTEGEFAAATAGSREPLGSVARGAIAGKAAQSPADAVSVAKDLTTPSTQRRIAKVAGQETADTLGAVGRTQVREISNLDKAAARAKDTGPIGEELGLGMEAVASMLGRAGPGFMMSLVRRGAASLTSIGISNKAAKAIAQAMLRQDRPFVEKMLNRLAKTERQRKVIVDAINAWAVGSASSTTANVR